MENFLKKFYTNDRASHTHTKIKCEKLNISGGSYNIPEEEIDNFYKVYKQHIFGGRLRLLTGPVLFITDLFVYLVAEPRCA